MIAILGSSILLLIFAVFYTFSGHLKTKKWLSFCFKSLLTNDYSKTNQSPSAKPMLSCSTDNCTKSEKLRGVFSTFDKNKDGYITKQELKESLKNIGISAGEGDVCDMLQKLDKNGDGFIDLDEFCEVFDEQQYECLLLSENRDGDEELKEAFDVFDENRDGVITVEELGLVLSSLGFTEGKILENCKEMIKKVDIDGDGKVNFDEFKTMMRSGFGNKCFKPRGIEVEADIEAEVIL